jgi:hypothetical protein
MSQPTRHDDDPVAADTDNGRRLLAELAAINDDRPAWQDHALCAETDPEAFYPEKGSSTREAKQICNNCEVRGDCLEAALVIWSSVTGAQPDQCCRAVDMSSTRCRAHRIADRQGAVVSAVPLVPTESRALRRDHRPVRRR